MSAPGFSQVPSIPEAGCPCLLGWFLKVGIYIMQEIAARVGHRRRGGAFPAVSSPCRPPPLIPWGDLVPVCSASLVKS